MVRAIVRPVPALWEFFWFLIEFLYIVCEQRVAAALLFMKFLSLFMQNTGARMAFSHGIPHKILRLPENHA